jgi:hypothetical protein
LSLLKLISPTPSSVMKLLLDEDLPSKLRYRLRPEHDVSVQDMGWRGKKNGERIIALNGNCWYSGAAYRR